ncbi:beta strand repeat-containing protein [Bradyrhizobium lablabi]|uniref:beta strand repeat-containing protein n=1 Tax=Bradyrhizobium lablabi TaxID=722472 RepID=UPI0015614A87
MLCGIELVADGGLAGTLVFSDIASTDVRFSQDGTSLVITGLTEKTVTVLGEFSPFRGGRLQTISFSDGVSLTPGDVKKTLIDQESAADGGAVYGFDYSDDTIAAGLGDKYLYGGFGDNDTYIYTPSGGNTTIDDDSGTLVMQDIASTGVTLSNPSNSYDVILTVTSTGKAVTLKNELTPWYSGLTVNFSDGVSWNRSQISNLVFEPVPTVITSEVLANDKGPSHTDYVTSDGHVTLTGTVRSGSSVSIFDGTKNVGSAIVSGTGWTFSTDLGDGTHQLQATATGSNGTSTTSGPAATIVVDTTAPQPVTSGIAQGQNAALVLNGTSEASSVVEIFDGTTLLGAATADASGLWSLTTTSLADALHTFSVTASDLAGNVGSGASIVQYGGSGVDVVDIATTLQASNFVYDATNADWHVSATGVAETLSRVESVVDGAGHRFLLVGGGSQYATIQAAVNAASNGDTILIAPGSYTENVAIVGKALSLEGFGGTTLHGSITETGTLNGALTIDGIAIDATGQQYGVLVSANSTGFAGSVILDHASIANAQLNGFAYIESGNGSTPTHTDTVGSISILNSVFSGNATQTSGSNGRGDILLYGYNGNFTANGVTIENPGAGAQKAIQMRGVQTGANTVNVGPYQSSGDIALTDLNVSGTYTQDLLAFYRYADLGSFNASGVTLNAAAPWGLLNFDEVGGTVDLSNGISATNLAAGAPVAVEQGLNSGNTFVGTSGNDILVSNGGTDTLIGGAGNNTYVASRSGQTTIDANWAAGATNVLDFVGGITDQNLWFQQSGNDLKIDLIGTNTQVDVNGWFANSNNQLQEISAGGLKLDSQILQLVQAMATYSAANPGFDPTNSSIHTAPNDTSLQNSMAAAWHA